MGLDVHMVDLLKSRCTYYERFGGCWFLGVVLV